MDGYTYTGKRPQGGKKTRTHYAMARELLSYTFESKTRAPGSKNGPKISNNWVTDVE